MLLAELDEELDELLELGFDELALEEELLDELEDALLELEGLLLDAEELELLELLDEAALEAGCEELAGEELADDELELAGKLLEAELDAILEELVGVLEEELDATLEELAGALDALLELDGMLLDAEELLASLDAALLATLEDAGAPPTPQPVRIRAVMTADAATAEMPRKRPCFNLIMISPLFESVMDQYNLMLPPQEKLSSALWIFGVLKEKRSVLWSR